MTGTIIPAVRLAPGAIIHIRHVHDPALGKCLCGAGKRDVEVVGIRRDPDDPAHVAVDWQGCTRLLGGTRQVTGTVVYGRTAPVLVLGHVWAAA
ncbi:MAG: hypothetical protein J2P30_06670 [Actinobacteria bacterium]|nr:hypothetical protein [Actinomycetota bacterium]